MNILEQCMSDIDAICGRQHDIRKRPIKKKKPEEKKRKNATKRKGQNINQVEKAEENLLSRNKMRSIAQDRGKGQQEDTWIDEQVRADREREEQQESFTFGEKIAFITKQTMNEVEIDMNGKKIKQNRGFVQGGADCVQKFADVFEDIINAQKPKDVRATIYVDDVAIQGPQVRVIDHINHIIGNAAAAGLKLGHGPDKDALFIPGTEIQTRNRNFKGIETRQEFRYLGYLITKDRDLQPRATLKDLGILLKEIAEGDTTKFEYK